MEVGETSISVILHVSLISCLDIGLQAAMEFEIPLLLNFTFDSNHQSQRS
jgi:hypothetical protein